MPDGDRFEPNEEQRAATEALAVAIQNAYDVFIKPENINQFKGNLDETMIMEWVVLVGTVNDDQTSVDYLLPHFPSIPMHHIKGMLVECLDDLREVRD